MNEEIEMDYNPENRQALLTFPGGRTLKVSGVSLEQAQAFKEKHGREFQRRDLCLTTSGVIQTREGSNG
jgi:hypothetical protein